VEPSLLDLRHPVLDELLVLLEIVHVCLETLRILCWEDAVLGLGVLLSLRIILIFVRINHFVVLIF
jgi:hypothetical protein